MGCANRDTGTRLQRDLNGQVPAYWIDEIPGGCVYVYVYFSIYMAPEDHFKATFWPQQLPLKSNER